jgi:ATP-dependent Clp protease protease subunit
MRKMIENKPRERVFMLGDQVTQATVSSIIKAIWEIKLEDGEKETVIINYERIPIHLILNTYGGSVYDGLGLIGAMEASETPIHVTVLGSAMSMGLFILCAGHHRRMHAYSTLMYHQISTVSMDKLEGIKKDLAECDRLEKMCESILTKRTTLTIKELEEHKRAKGEWYIDAGTAAKYGIIDEIIAGELAIEDLKKIEKSMKNQKKSTSTGSKAAPKDKTAPKDKPKNDPKIKPKKSK